MGGQQGRRQDFNWRAKHYKQIFENFLKIYIKLEQNLKYFPNIFKNIVI
jgi:hypothetical protein